jgi:hypothetical protein
MKGRSGPKGASLLVPGVSVGVACLMCLGPGFLGTAGAGAAALAPSGVTVPLHWPSGNPAASPRAQVGGRDGPHPGTLEIWESSSGGPETVDPSICYYAVCDEPISNVYETLVAYNGSDDGPTPTNFVPELATCVPGSIECAAQFGGNDLVWTNNSTGAPEYYTFEIDSGARFYDAAHGASWPVYPSDVVFTFARTMGFSDLQFEEQTNGWINTQDLVPTGNFSWDAGIHAPLNNTPGHILDAFLVNDSTYCPTSVVVSTHGCVTFKVSASGLGWPFFLELVADNLGASIEPCGWYTYQGGSVPGFLGTNASYGDGPCLLPGGTTNTSLAGYQEYIDSVGPEGWDTFEQEADNWPGDQPSVQWSDVGSGPYYVDNPIDPATGYTLEANPAYTAPVGCASQPGCMPVAGTYIPAVDVVWESGTVGDQNGLTELAVGQADSAGFFSNDLPVVESDARNYSVLANVPTLTIGFFPFTLDFNVTNEQTIDPTGLLNVPGTFFQNDALRQFLVNAYPYRTIDSTYDTVNGTMLGEGYGGAIPHDLGPYYDAGIDWPQGNPTANSSVVGNVTWWWDEANNASSPLYDPQLAGCNSTDPCRWATFSFFGDTPLDDEFNDWNGEVANLSGGSLQPYLVDVGNCLAFECCGYLGGYCPGGSALTVYDFGWAPDYPDPSDYMAPMYYPNNSYTYPDALSETLGSSPNNASSCPDDYGAFSNLTYWAGVGEIPTACQGAAYDTMVAWMNVAAYESSASLRIVEYNLIEQIANELALYVYDPQSVAVLDYGHWIEPSTINTNPVVGGGGDQLWYDWNYVSNFFNATFTEVGLSAGSEWNVTVAGISYSSGSPSLEVSGLANGSFNFTVGSLPGYTAAPAHGNFTIAGADETVSITFTSRPPPPLFLTIQEYGLPPATEWNVLVSPISAGGSETNISGASETLVTPVDAGVEYSYAPGTVGGFATPAQGTIVIEADATVTVLYGPEYPITFEEVGLAAGTSWSVTVGNLTDESSSMQSVFSEPNGSYPDSVAPVRGYMLESAPDNVTVNGSPVSVMVRFAAIVERYPLNFVESGLPTGTNWTVSVGGSPESSPGATISFLETNGTYTFAVGSVPGYVASAGSGSVTLAGVNRSVTVTFTPDRASPEFLGLSWTDWLAVGLVTALAVGLVVIGLRRRPARASTNPPPTPAPPRTSTKAGPPPKGNAGIGPEADLWRPPRP